MWLLEGLAELIAPTRCAGCEMPGSLLCAACDATLPRVDPQRACPSCGAPYGALVCTECWSTAYAFDAVLTFGELDGPLGRAVVLHKDSSERRLGALLGGLLAERVATEWGEWCDEVCWVPPTRAALARRGFDHCVAIATPVAARLGVRLEARLARASARDQRRLGRSQRLEAAAGSFTATGKPKAHVLVIDDVLTTGATLDSAARTLLGAGAREVRVAVVARAW